jgi:hypothetical protein
MNALVKILTSDDGETRRNPKWHLAVSTTGDFATFCEGEFFGLGASGCEYETKTSKRGGITCPLCLEKIREIKKVKL